MKQIMMKGRQRVKGTVLFTVVSVMMIMVLFLMSTLILTASANRRSYYTYYQTQAQYAAQSALDCITNYAYSNKEFSDWVQSAEVCDGSEHEIFIRLRDTEMPLSDPNAPEESVRCTIRQEDPNYIYDQTTKMIHKRQQWKIVATAVVGAGRNQTSAQTATYLYSNVKPPKSTSLTNKIDYTFYTYDEVDSEETETIFTPDPDSPFTAIANAVYSLTPTGSTDNVVVLGPQFSNMTQAPKGRTKYGTDFQKIDNNISSVSDSIYIGNASIEVNTFFKFQRKGEGIQYYGNLRFKNAGTYFDAEIDESLQKTAWKYKDQNYLYVDGTVSAEGGQGYIGYRSASGKSDRPVNMYAGAMQFSADNHKLTVCGDVYLYDPSLDSSWSAQSTTMLTDFVQKELSGGATAGATENAAYSGGIHGNLVCNNKSLTLGNITNPVNAETLKIDGNLIYTNPTGSVDIGARNFQVGGKAIFACPRNKVNLHGTNFTAAGGIVYSDDTGYAAALEEVLKTCDPAGKYGDATLTDYKAESGANYNFSLFPFNYRLDEICDIYYRWDLQNVSNWDTDPLIKESTACGHTWDTKDFTVNGAKVTVPWTTPIGGATSGNIIIKAYEPIEQSKAMEHASGSTISGYTSLTGFKTDMKSTVSITSDNKATYGYSGSLTWAFPTDTGVSTTSTNVYYIAQNCEVDMSALDANEILFIDPTQATAKPLYIALKGSVDDKIILINNTAVYTGGVTSPAYSYTYGTTGHDGKGDYAGRTDVYLFLENGVTLGKGMILTTGVAGGFAANSLTIANGSFDTIAKSGSGFKLDVVSNPYYPGQTQWNSLTGGEKYKFMYVPNDVIFGESGATYKFTNGGMFAGAVMMPYSTVSHTTQAPSPNIDYREDHTSVKYNAGANRALINVGSMVVNKLGGENWPMVAYLGDGNRTGGGTTTTVHKKEVKSDGGESGGGSKDPAYSDGKDFFNNDHQGAN